MRISPPNSRHVEDVILNRRADATERLLNIAEKYKSGGKKEQIKEDLSWRENSPEERIKHALVKGIDQFVDQDVEEPGEMFPRRCV
ncbi:MAG: hypothetical protein U1F16_05280 [Turneriella sp.]